MSTSLFIVTSFCWGMSLPPAAQQPRTTPAPSVQEVRDKLGSFEFVRERQELLRLGESAFPAYLTILKDPNIQNLETAQIFSVLRDVQADRSGFVDHAVRWLTVPEGPARASAILLLGRIGSPKDASPLVALLWDRDISINWSAMEALAALGGDRELVALDIWAQANAESLRIDSRLRQRTEQVRDALRKRAEEERKQAGGQAAWGQPDRPVLSVQEVRRLLTELPGNPTPVRELVALGERAYPALEAFLNDPAVTDFEAMRLFAQLSLMPGDRSRFAPHVVRWLRSYLPRREAVHLLGAIGSRRDAAPLVALLYDSNPDIVRLALEAVGKLGGEREMVAIDIWIRAKTDALSAAEQARDALRKRAEEEKKKDG